MRCNILRHIGGVMVAASVYLILDRNLIRFIFGLVLVGNAINLLIFTVGGLDSRRPPIIPNIRRCSGTVRECAAPGPDPDGDCHRICAAFLYLCSFLSRLSGFGNRRYRIDANRRGRYRISAPGSMANKRGVGMSGLLIWPILLPLAGGVAAIFVKQVQAIFQLALTTADSIRAGGLLLWHVHLNGIIATQIGNWPAPFGITFVADRLSA